MIDNPEVPRSRFPVLVERCAEGALDADGRTSPDGHPSDIYLAEYVASETIAGDAMVMLREVAPSPADDRDATWMPDGRVAFISNRDGGDRLYAIKPGQPRPDLLVDRVGVRQAAFAPDGREMALVVDTADGHELWRIGGDGAAVLETALGHACTAQYSPDGGTLLVQRDGRPEDLGLYALDVRSGEVTRVLAGDVHHACYAPDGWSVAYVRSVEDGEALCLLDLRTGAERVLVSSVPEGMLDLSFSPDGTRLLLHAGLETRQGALAWFESATYVTPISGGVLRQIQHADALRSEPKPDRIWAA